MILAATNNILPLMILSLVAVIVVAVCTVIALTWTDEPWFRKSPKPRRQLDNDRDRVKDYNLRKKYPEAFVGAPEFKEDAVTEEVEIKDLAS